MVDILPQIENILLRQISKTVYQPIRFFANWLIKFFRQIKNSDQMKTFKIELDFLRNLGN